MDKSRIIGFCSIHYGSEYFKEALRSIKNHVDKVVVAYSRKPSHGYPDKGLICPDTEEVLKKIAEDTLGDQLIWDSADFYPNEASHREVRYKYIQDRDLIITIDADEVFKEDEIDNAIDVFLKSGARYGGIVGYLNFWRSFDYVNRDHFAPIRMENLRVENTQQFLSVPLTVYHFSTAQSDEMVRYKQLIFGHAGELQSDWFDKYFSWTPEKKDEIFYLHPTSLSIWHRPEPFDKTTIPDSLKQHANYNKQLIQ